MREPAQSIVVDNPDYPPYRPRSGRFLSSESQLACLQQLLRAQSVKELVAIYGRQVATCCPGSHLLTAADMALETAPGEAELLFRHQSELVYGGQWLATLEYGSDNAMHWGRMQRLEALQQLLAPLFLQQQKLAELQQLSQRDCLTGLYNRRSFEEQLKRAIEQGRRQRSMLSLMIIDLDRFKQINDTHGHLCGDRVLCELAETLRLSIRSSDSAFRLGGDEFAVLLQPASAASAQAVSERLRYNSGQSGHLRRYLEDFSIGHALWEPRESWQDLYHRADEDLYRHKPCHRSG